MSGGHTGIDWGQTARDSMIINERKREISRIRPERQLKMRPGPRPTRSHGDHSARERQMISESLSDLMMHLH